jgi:phospholipase/carboxylesterase
MSKKLLDYEKSIAGLNCRVIEPDTAGEETPTVIALHGYGANCHDLAPLSQSFSPQYRWIFPEGPESLPMLFDAHAWFQLRIDDFVMNAQMQRWDNITVLRYPVLEVVAERVLALRQSVAKAPVVLAGFSQGSLVCLHAALQLDLQLSGLILWSPTLIERVLWSERLAAKKLPAILMSHGEVDPVLPFELAVELRSLLAKSQDDIEFISFYGGHTIPAEVLAATRQFIEGRHGFGGKLR